MSIPYVLLFFTLVTYTLGVYVTKKEGSALTDSDVSAEGDPSNLALLKNEEKEQRAPIQRATRSLAECGSGKPGERPLKKGGCVIPRTHRPPYPYSKGRLTRRPVFPDNLYPYSTGKLPYRPDFPDGRYPYSTGKLPYRPDFPHRPHPYSTGKLTRRPRYSFGGPCPTRKPGDKPLKKGLKNCYLPRRR